MRHMQLRARDALDEGVGRPGALLELQLSPLDLQVVAARVERLELDEQRRARGACSRSRRRRSRAPPPTAAAGRCISATPARSWQPLGHAQQGAARARVALELRRIRRGSCDRPSFRRGRACTGTTGRRRSAGSTCDSRCMKRLTTRSSSEWKLMTARRPPGLKTSSAAARPCSSWPSSSLMNMRSAWNVRVAGCLPGSRVRTAPATSAASCAGPR